MCICEALKEAGDCAKAVCFFLVCMLCAGPILVIVGIVMIVSPNHRADDVKQYNDAIKQYNSTPIRSWSGTIGGTAASVTSKSVEVEGSNDGVDPATSYFAQANIISKPPHVAYNIVSISPFSRNSIQYSKNTSKDAICSEKKGCSSDSMRSYCTRKYGSSTTYTGTGCPNSGNCGTCEFIRYLITYCAVVSSISSSANSYEYADKLILNNQLSQSINIIVTNNTNISTTANVTTTNFVTTITSPYKYQEDSDKKSCFYPFGSPDQDYSNSQASSVAFQLRTSDDPFITLQRITKGTNEFGISSKDQRLMGLVLLIIGAIIIACIGLVGYCVYRLINGATENNNQDQDNDYQQQMQPYYPPPQQPQPSYPPKPGDDDGYQQAQPYYPPPQPPYYPPPQNQPYNPPPQNQPYNPPAPNQPYNPPPQPSESPYKPEPQGYGYGQPSQQPPQQGYGYGYNN